MPCLHHFRDDYINVKVTFKGFCFHSKVNIQKHGLIIWKMQSQGKLLNLCTQCYVFHSTVYLKHWTVLRVQLTIKGLYEIW